MKVKNFLSIFMISVLALSAFSACSQSAEKTQKRSNEVLQKSNEQTMYTSDAFIDSSIVDSCKKISVYNYSNVEISDKEAISSICDALKNGKYEEAPAKEISEDMIRVLFNGDGGLKTLYLSDNLVLTDGKAYRDSSKSLINAVKACSDNYIIDSLIADSCDRIYIYNYSNVEISDKEAISSICDALKNGKYEEVPAVDISKGMIKVEFSDNRNTLYLSDDLIIANGRAYRDSTKSLINAVKDYTDKYIMDSCILDSCDKIVMSGCCNDCDVTVTDKSEIAEICESIKNTEFTFFDLGYGMGKAGGIYVEFFYNGFSQGFQPGEEIYVNRLGFRADNTEFRDIIFKYYDKYRENQ